MPHTKPRLFILTDISSCETGVREPDDAQSLVRLLYYANEFCIEGLCATSNMRHGPVCRPEIIHQIINAYAQDFANLARVDSGYMQPDALRAVVFAGESVAGPDIPVDQCVGAGKLSPAAQHLISVVDRGDSRSLWIAVWGGTADLAQALYQVRASRSPAALALFLSRLRVLAISDQDTTAEWIRQEFPTVWYWRKTLSFRGMYRGGNTALCTYDWVNTHLTHGRGALAQLYPNYKGGDIWWQTLGGVYGIKEGDTPSWLGLIPNGLHLPEHPELGGWGGRAIKVASFHFEDAVDTDVQDPSAPDPRMSTVFRWREDFQSDFLIRLNWAAGNATNAMTPFPMELHPRIEAYKQGIPVLLNATDYLPESNLVDAHWQLYPKPETADVECSETGPGKCSVCVMGNTANEPIAIVLKATYGAELPLIRYVRVLLNPA
ncbi:MAG: DUF1593 domain-containing protein [Verrucomicrobiota bacterium]|nr:DUF1593 domain-containing protein [Verrucomicrobiota bacterium]